MKLCLKTVPVIKCLFQFSFLPVSITQFLSSARFICREALRVTKHATFRAPSSIRRVGCVHADQSDSKNVGTRARNINKQRKMTRIPPNNPCNSSNTPQFLRYPPNTRRSRVASCRLIMVTANRTTDIANGTTAPPLCRSLQHTARTCPLGNTMVTPPA